MRPFLALLRLELLQLFSQPAAYLALSGVAAITALLFFDHLRLYNQTLFLYASTTMGGFETDTVPDYVNLRDTVFFPVMETLGITLIVCTHDLGEARELTERVAVLHRGRGVALGATEAVLGGADPLALFRGEGRAA